MSNVYPFRTEEQMFDDASLWITRLDRGLSENEQAALRRWLDDNPRHRQCLLEMAALWDRMDSLSILSELFDAPVQQQVGHSSRPTRWGWAAAASVLAVAVAVGALAPRLARQTGPATELPVASAAGNTVYETGIGAHSTINLPDGTRLLLNTNTRVSVAYSKEQRLLELLRGELHVEVAHDPQRPLRVKAGKKIVEAVGTAFNVYLVDEQSFDVIVTEGRVWVKDISDTASDGVVPVRELEEGQKLSVRASEPKAVEQVDEAVIHDRLSWRDGNLVFRGETLRQALDEVSRYTPLTFKITDPRIADVRIAGLYRAGDIDGLLLALKENFDIEHQRTEDGTVLLSLKKPSPTRENSKG